VAVLPAVLPIVFGAIWLYDRSHGGSSLPGSPPPTNLANRSRPDYERWNR
jgi:hypothetical protein